MGASHSAVKRSTALAHPSDQFRGDACDKGVRGYILGDNRTGRDHRVPTDCNAAKDCRICPQRGPVLNLRVHLAPVWADRSWVQVIREANVRSDENTIAEGDSAVDRREILDFAVVPD